MINVAVEQTLIVKEQQKQITLIEGKINKRGHSSGSSTRSAGSGRKKHKLGSGSNNEEDTDNESTEYEKENL